MSRYHGNDDQCPECDLRYGAFRTGLSYQEVHERLKDYSEDSADWTYKRRGTVLGKWHQYKREAWARHLDECRSQAEFERGDAFEGIAIPATAYSGVPF